jgi:hypothetical protein
MYSMTRRTRLAQTRPAVRRLFTHHLDAAVSPDWALLQVDFSNAFNLVRRYVFFQSTLCSAMGFGVTSPVTGLFYHSVIIG